MKGNLADLKFMVLLNTSSLMVIISGVIAIGDSQEKLRNAGMRDLRTVFVRSLLLGCVFFCFYYSQNDIVACVKLLYGNLSNIDFTILGDDLQKVLFISDSKSTTKTV